MQSLKKRTDLLAEEIEDEVVIYDPRTHYVHHLNPMASIIWELFDVSPSPKDIAKEIVNVLKTDLSNVEKDVQETLGKLQRKGLME
ncbi:MAG: PqqD family protein [Planctomycetota bacterium]|nr:PqqD family peptide modification chaperone [Planctomycetota bacterium]MDE1889469.1 PqqD family protein [Planctomycetota bacterium]MDE2217770.1 PqqD family protein [Planctomycetota bacterium]